MLKTEIALTKNEGNRDGIISKPLPLEESMPLTCATAWELLLTLHIQSKQDMRDH